MEKTDIKAVLDRLGLSATFQFVPFSQSRNKDEKDPSLNYIVTVTHNGRTLFSCDYMMGCGHAPSYKQGDRTLSTWNAIKYECGTGRTARKFSHIITNGPAILPNVVDVFYSLVMDSDAINYTFEEWAGNYGLDTDSRKAEKMYQQCLQQGIKLRAAISEAGLTALQEAYQDY